MVSIHPPPLSSSSPLPWALHPKARCPDWQGKDFPQWKGGGLPPWGVGWGRGGGGPHISVELGPRSHHGVWVCISRSQKKHYPRTALPSGWLLLPFQSWVMVSWFLVT